jgi:tetratricopeptide (TPR) repeat protein
MTPWIAEPESTLRWANQVLSQRNTDAGTRSQAWQAKAVAHAERGELALARRAARRALPQAHLILAWIEQDAGNTQASQRHLDLARPRGHLLPRAHCLRGINFCVAGDHLRAHHALSLAIRGFRRYPDQHWLANALNARGIASIGLHRLPAATRDLTRAGAQYAQLGQPERAALCIHNRGCVALQAGDIPAALRLFDDAVRAGLRVNARPEALIDRATALMRAGLVAEAGTALAEAAHRLGAAGRNMRLADAWLMLASCAGDIPAARRAIALFRAQRRTGWLAAAEAIHLRLTLGPDSLPLARRLANRCAHYGFPVEAAELRLATGHRDLLKSLQANRFSGPRRLRVLGWTARARLAALEGNRRGVFAACRAGLRVAGDEPGELVQIALAAASGKPGAVLRWAELCRVSIPELAAALGRRTLLRFVAHEGKLLAVSVVDGRVRCHDLGTPPDAEALRFALVRRRETELAQRIDATLLAPVRELIEDRSLVVVPAGGLHGLPWAALPSCFGRPVSVAPSAAAWLHASRLPYSWDDPVWVAGPGLRHADLEVVALHRSFGGRLLTGIKSTVDSVRCTAEGAGLVHIAAHGRYRLEAPLYSYLELADGPLYGHDLAPRVLVLSACEGALSATLRPRTRALIASTVPVADDGAARLMTVLHRDIRRLGPAEALARAQVECGDRGFVCVGAG